MLHMNDTWDWSMTLSLLLMVGFWVGMIWTVMMLTRRPNPPRSAPNTPNSLTAMDIIERRFAGGELSDEEFEVKKRRLTASACRTPGAVSHPKR